MAGREPDIGPTARTVAENVKRLRELQGLKYTDLSERLRTTSGWLINAVGIRRIESTERRVTVDDLVALSATLGVSPAALLYPIDTPHANDQIGVTGLRNTESARIVWDWMTATHWAYMAAENITGFDVPSSFLRRTWPRWLLETEGTKGLLEIIDAGWAEARENARQRLLSQPPAVQLGDD